MHNKQWNFFLLPAMKDSAQKSYEFIIAFYVDQCIITDIYPLNTRKPPFMETQGKGRLQGLHAQLNSNKC